MVNIWVVFVLAVIVLSPVYSWYYRRRSQQRHEQETITRAVQILAGSHTPEDIQTRQVMSGVAKRSLEFRARMERERALHQEETHG